MHEHSTDPLHRGISLFKAGQLALAEIEFEKALTEKRQSAQAYYFLGMIAFQQSKVEQAEQMFFRAIELNPLYAESYNSLGVLYDLSLIHI